MRSLFFVISVFILLYLFIQKKISLSIIIGTISLLTFLDLYLIDKKYIDKGKFSKISRIAAYQPDEADTRILTDDSQYRVLNLTVDVFNDATTSYHHSSVGGYHGAKLRRYQDLIENHINPEIQQSISQIQSGTLNITGIPILNMLNTKYFKLSNTANAVLPNSSAMGNAWFVSNVLSVSDADASIAVIGSTDLSTIAISEKLEARSGLSIGSISLSEYQPNYLKYQTSNQGGGFAVFSEIYYEKGWKAYIDGNESPIHQVNYVLRGLEIPAGQHLVEFRFEPNSYYVGNSIMWIGSVLVIVLLFFSIALEMKKEDA
jgi:hypothetical protein